MDSMKFGKSICLIFFLNVFDPTSVIGQMSKTEPIFRGISKINTPPSISHEGILHITTVENKVIAVNSNGETEWQFTLDETATASPTIGRDGSVYVVADDDYIYAINRDGSEKWKFKTEGDLSSAPALSESGLLYVGYGKTLYLNKTNSDELSKSKPKYEKDGELWGNINDTSKLMHNKSSGGLLAINSDTGNLKWELKDQIDTTVFLERHGGYEYNVGISTSAVTAAGGIDVDIVIETGSHFEFSPVIGTDNDLYAAAGEYVFSIDATTGKINWKTKVACTRVSSPLSLISGGITLYDFVYDFASSDGGFEVSSIQPNALPGPFEYNADKGTWVSEGGASGCIGPFDSILTTPEITVPSSGDVVLELSHRYSFEPDSSIAWDIGQVRVSVNGGQFVTVASGSFFENGYFSNAVAGAGMMKGLFGFSGQTEGYWDGAFITSKAIIGKMAAGDKFKVQFISGHDECSTGAKPNWEIDSVSFVGHVPIFEGEVAGDQSVYVNDNQIVFGTYGIIEERVTGKYWIAEVGGMREGLGYRWFETPKVHSINAKTGKLKWNKETYGRMTRSPIVGANGRIYLTVNRTRGKRHSWDDVTNNGKVWLDERPKLIELISLTGKENQVLEFDSDLAPFSAITVDNSVLHSDGLSLNLRDVNGGILNLSDFPKKIDISPIIDITGHIYVPVDNNIYVINGTSLANSQWPMVNGNPQRTGRAPSPVVDKIQINAFSKSDSPFTISFESKSGSTYTIEASHDLTQWGELGEVQGTGSSVEFTDPRLPIVPFERNYYRVKLVE